MVLKFEFNPAIPLLRLCRLGDVVQKRMVEALIKKQETTWEVGDCLADFWAAFSRGGSDGIIDFIEQKC